MTKQPQISYNIQVSTFTQCCAYSVGQAAQPIISTNYGAGKGERIKETLRLALGTTALFGIFWTALSMVCPNLYIRALSFLLLPFNIFSTYYFQAIMKPSVASVARGLVISGLLILLLPIITGSDFLWFAMPITEAVTAIYAAIIIRKYTRALP